MIHVENLTRYFGDLCAVDHINLEIQKGEILGLLGPNGAGKTTTLRMLTGFLRPSSGTIRVKDYTVEENSLEIRKLLGYLPESAPLYHDMLVYDYLDYVARMREIDGKNRLSRISQMAETCGLKEVMHKPIGELSKGYKQRVGLAHAMMKDPEILVLDEPTSGLDPNQIIEIRGIIKQIGKEKTIIISTHILSEAEATCDRVVIINQGKIVADGTMEELNVGSYETILTLPVTFWEVIMGKFLASAAFVAAMLVPTLAYPISVSFMGDIDWGPVIGGYVGAILLGASYSAVGLFASSLTRNQIIAFIVAMAICFNITLVDKILFFLPGKMVGVLEYLGTDFHFENIAKGIIDSWDVIYFLSVIFVGLYATDLVMEEKS
ncbi:MAG: ATP-binding cassette domain-containing protein [Deltaproteobacteria bacterium]|nr:ATP-binding cassette domain-containing protein [Deltaproteobacteria bacterium]